MNFSYIDTVLTLMIQHKSIFNYINSNFITHTIMMPSKFSCYNKDKEEPLNDTKNDQD